MIQADFINRIDSDLMVVNAARVSFNKHVTELGKGDAKLIAYLASHGHFTPFTHCRETFHLRAPLDFAELDYTDIAGMVWDSDLYRIRHSIWGWARLSQIPGLLTPTDLRDIANVLWERYPLSAYAMGMDKYHPEPFGEYIPEFNPNFIDVTLRETVPIIVARQRFKHMVGFTYNEVSRRYVDDTPEFFTPDEWRSRPDGSLKQGSGGTIQHNMAAKDLHRRMTAIAQNTYKELLALNAAPEMARMELPQSMLTSYYVTAPLTAWARAYKLRNDAHAQLEIQELAHQWNTLIRSHYPATWSRLVD